MINLRLPPPSVCAFTAHAGSMSLGESKGGLPPDRVTEDEEAVLRDSRRVVETYHDPGRFALRRVVLAPCSPFSVTPELMRQSALLARSFGAAMNVHLHTHLAETKDEEEFCLQRFGYRPGDYAEQLGWIGDDVWHAHCVHLNQPEVELFGRTHTGVAHCPTSNMRLASGIAPVRSMRDAGVPVGLGVDGSASNDGSHLLNEVRQCLLLQRVLGDPQAMTAREALEIATLWWGSSARPRRYRQPGAGDGGGCRGFRAGRHLACRRRSARSGGSLGLLPAARRGLCPGEWETFGAGRCSSAA